MYRGTLVAGLKVGTGVLEFACRDEYVGEFADDAINGLGVYSFSGRGTYSGEVAAYLPALPPQKIELITSGLPARWHGLQAASCQSLRSTRNTYCSG